jgi:hypothetical protein
MDSTCGLLQKARRWQNSRLIQSRQFVGVMMCWRWTTPSLTGHGDSFTSLRVMRATGAAKRERHSGEHHQQVVPLISTLGSGDPGIQRERRQLPMYGRQQ